MESSASLGLTLGWRAGFVRCRGSPRIRLIAGFDAFAIVTYGVAATPGAKVLAPIATSLAVFSVLAWLNRQRPVDPKLSYCCTASRNSSRLSRVYRGFKYTSLNARSLCSRRIASTSSLLRRNCSGVGS